MKHMHPIGILMAFLLVLPESGMTRKLLILGVDGCRPDALLEADAPNLRALADSGLYSWWALSRPPTKSGPCWSSIFTGVWNDRHGVTDNTFANARYNQYPLLFQRLKNTDPSFYAAWFVYWPDLGTRMPHAADVAAGDWSDDNTLEHALDFLADDEADAAFVHFGAIDAAGHTAGFDPENGEYLNAIHTVDEKVGRVISAMKSRPHYANEDWMVITLTDHGGYTTHHGGTLIEEMRTFFIINGNDVPHEEIPHNWINRSLRVPSYGLQLNGAGDYITIPDRAEYHFGTDQDFSIELCIRTSGWSGTPILFANKDITGTQNPGFAFILIDEGKWRVNIADGSLEKNISGPIIADNHWHHLAAVFRRGGTLTLFQDGIQTGGIDISEIGNVNTPYGFVLGQDGTENRPAFVPGMINEIRVWTTALSDTEIEKWIFTPVTPDHPEYSDLAGYWKMNDGEGTMIRDSGPAANNGTFFGTNPEWIIPKATVETLAFDSCQCAKVVDLTATALAHFGIGINPEWNLDGRNLVPAGSQNAVQAARTCPESPVILTSYPNPFNAEMIIEYAIPECSDVRLVISNVQGQKIWQFDSYNQMAGSHTVKWNGSAFGSGIYILTLHTRPGIISRRMLLLK